MSKPQNRGKPSFVLPYPVRRGDNPVLRGEAAAEQRDGRARGEEGAEADHAVTHHAAAAVAILD